MKKLLVLFSSTLLSFTSVSKLETKIDSNQNSNLSKQWCFKPINIKTIKSIGQSIYFAIDNINLSSIGIKSIDQLHTYSVIEIPNLKIKCSDIIFLSSDKWNPKIRKLGSEKWRLMLNNIRINGDTMISLESAATLWHNNAGNLMMRLAYRIWMNSFLWVNYPVREFTLQTGSCIKIY